MHVRLSNRNDELSYASDPAQVLQPQFVVASLWVEEQHQSLKLYFQATGQLIYCQSVGIDDQKQKQF
jgi:hypothetical protein